MNKKFSRILGVGLTLMVLVSLMAVASPATPASADTLLIAAESDYPKTENNVIAPAGTDIFDIAISGNTIFAATNDTANNGLLYKSTDAGKTWKSLKSSTDYPATQITLVAIAPDDVNTVIIAGANLHVYYSSNGGSSWGDMGIPTTTIPAAAAAHIYAIDVSGGSTHYVAVATDNASNTATLFTMKLAIAQIWEEQTVQTNTAVPILGFKAGQAYIKAVQFSPNFVTDKIVTVVSGNTTNAYFQVFRYETGQYAWNGNISFFNATDWGVSTLGGVSAVGVSATTFLPNAITGGLTAASIALDPGYLGTDPTTRLAYVGTTAGGTTYDGLTRINDVYEVGFATWSSGYEGGIDSVALSGGKLVAGRYSTNVVYSTAAPTAVTPKFDRTNTLKQPGGQNKTIVGFVGTTVVAGTAGDESAFAVSADSGYSFNDISLIDTTLGMMSDVAVNAAGSKIYLTTTDNQEGTGQYDTSVWLKVAGSAWLRVLNLKQSDFGIFGFTAYADAHTAFLVRLAPENDSAVYLSSKSTTDMWVSKDSGQNKWTSIPAYKLDNAQGVQDFAVKDANTVYAVDLDEFSSSTSSGAGWNIEVSLDGLNATNLVIAPDGDILVGGTDFFSFSTDAGATFARSVTSPDNGAGGNVYIVPDMNYGTNNVVYAAVGTKVWRGLAQQTAQTWDDRGPTNITAGQVVTGAGIVVSGSSQVIYVLTGNATAGTLFRALSLTPTVANSTLALWSNMPTTAFGINAAPQALKISAGPKLWFINTSAAFPAAMLYSMVDPIATAAPVLTGPTTGTMVELNRQTGKAYNVTFTWNRYSSSYVTQMELQISADSGFSAIFYDQVFGDGSTLGGAPLSMDNIAKVVGPSATNLAEWNPSATYYWRVRVAQNGPMYSPWSEVRNFSIAMPIAFNLVSPALGAVDVPVLPTFSWTSFQGALSYEIVVTTDKTFAVIDWSHTVNATVFASEETLKYSTNYYWRMRAQLGPDVSSGSKLVLGTRSPWVTGVFTTMAEPVAPTPPVVITPTPPTQIQVVQVPVAQPTPIPAYLLWMIIAVGAILVIALIILIVRTRRVT